MAMLRIEVNGSVVTNSVDHNDRDQRDRIVVPMFSIAEWLICNWWYIFYEVDKGEQSPDFVSRHVRKRMRFGPRKFSLGFCGDRMGHGIHLSDEVGGLKSR